ncbi:glycosyltransferase [Salinimicrobium sp. HB62]|uniref:glycosyltransferase n=1 Tax=Salinimicrobium sp. HB62 TaxID=3077781 RepID=UPI002D787333|nr:glycosyltransferase [Salinimicrobium sp. HB62]
MKPDQQSILFKIWKYPQLSETFITAQIITAIKCGYRVNILVEDLCSIEDSKQNHLFEKYGLKERIILEDYGIPSGKISRYFLAMGLVIYNLPSLKKLRQFLKRKKKFEVRYIYEFHFYGKLKDYDLIHVQFGTNARPLDLFKKIGLITSKLIVSFHGHDLYFPINGRISEEGYYDVLFKTADLLAVNTRFLKDILIRLMAPHEKIVTIPVAVDTEYFFPLKQNTNELDRGIQLISVGRLVKYKGHRYGIECVRKLKEKGYLVKYTIVGEGNQELELKNLISKYDLKENIFLTGRKSQNEIRNLMCNSEIFLMTSITDPDYGAESQGLVTAEAQACGLPVIGFGSGGVKYTISQGETGFIVPEKDVEAMMEKIEVLITNPDLRRRLGEKAQEFICENFSQKHINEVWRETYNNLITS